MGLVTRVRNSIGRSKGYGWCYRCHGTWDHTKEHQTPYGDEDDGRACFPLCEVCWSALTPGERLPYYRLLVQKWARLNPLDVDEYKQNWEQIKQSVENGL